MKGSTYDSTELEQVLDGFEAPIASSKLPRWQRKALQRQKDSVLNTPPKATVSKKMKKSTRKSVSKKKKISKTPRGDRFIPNRGAMDLDVSTFLLKRESSSENLSAESPKGKTPHKTPGGGNSTDEAFRESLAGSLFGRSAKKSSRKRVLAFKKKAPTSVDGYHDAVKVLYSSSNHSKMKKRVAPPRHIPSAPERVLDAPDMLDDYYLNLLDWSCNNVLAVALYGAVYLWNSDTGDIEELMSMEDENAYVSSIKWVKETGSANHLAVATNDGAVQLWDASKLSLVRTMRGHRERVGAMAWNAHMLSSGSRDTSIFTHDVRVARHHIQTMVGHQQEVCGLEWSPHDSNTLASGGNDNLLCLWDARRSSQQSQHEIAPRKTLNEHCAAVKALAWCPWQRNLLASGGGTADKTIKFWNTSNGACLNSIDCGSQVCSLLWNPNEKEILSSHGFSDNQLCLWKYPTMNKITELRGHSQRVLHLAMGPRADIVCSAGADETLRFWNVFGGRSRVVKKKSGMKMTSKKSRRLGRMTLR